MVIIGIERYAPFHSVRTHNVLLCGGSKRVIPKGLEQQAAGGTNTTVSSNKFHRMMKLDFIFFWDL